MDGSDRGEARFAWMVAGAFLIIALVKAATHEPWRDELSDWGAAWEASSFRAFAAWAHYCGHPLGWSALIYLFRRLCGSFAVLQYANALLATAAVWCFARWAPLPRAFRVLFALGFLPFHEWGVLVRPYCLTLAAGVAACAVASVRPRRPVALACILVVLSQTTVYGLVLAVALWAGCLVDQLDRSAERLDRRVAKVAKSGWIAGTALLAVSIAATIPYLIPPADSWHAVPWQFDLDPAHVGRSLAAVTDAFFPFRLPAPALPWDGRWMFGPVILLVATALVARRASGLVVWLLSAGGFLIFLHTLFPGAPRHRGHLFLAFILALWLAERVAPGDEPGVAAPRPSLGLRRARAVAIGILIAGQVPAGLYAAVRDLRQPFSQITAVASFLRESKLDGNPLVGHPGWATAPIGALLERQVDIPASGRTTAAVRYDDLLHKAASDEELVAEARRLAARGGVDAILLVDHALPAVLAAGPVIGVFPPGIIPDEKFWVYRVSVP